MPIQPVVVLITAPSLDSAREIASTLLERRLAACVNILPGVSSMYRWNDQVQEDQEVLLIAKTRQELLDQGLIALVQAHHPYELPEIIALPVIAGLPAYLAWIDANTALIPPPTI